MKSLVSDWLESSSVGFESFRPVSLAQVSRLFESMVVSLVLWTYAFI